MLIAVEGCTHGALDKIYETIQQLEKENNYKVDLLITCGDFQATRNLSDLKCMQCPDKYKDMCSFYKYYSGEKEAPMLTIFIGGNHEASNHLQELPYGGWVAKNIYYMGYASVININGVRIGGLSGIYNGRDYLLGHYEIVPYDNSSIRTIYHLRNLEVFRMKQLAQNPPQIMLSHDWPRGIYKHGNLATLLKQKQFLRSDVENDSLGSRPTMEVLEALKPEYWFSAHLHVKFPALVIHGKEETVDLETCKKTKFLSLDKCLPKRKFLQILDIGLPVKDGEKPFIRYDAAWLAVLRSTNHLLSVKKNENYMPGPLTDRRFEFLPTRDEIADVERILQGDLTIPFNFQVTAPPFDPEVQNLSQIFSIKQPKPRQNPQNVQFCEKFDLSDPVDLILNGKWPDIEQENQVVDFKVPTSGITSNFPPPINPPGFVIDKLSSTDDNKIDLGDDDDDDQEEKVEVKPSPEKKLKRRNQMLYSNQED